MFFLISDLASGLELGLWWRNHYYVNIYRYQESHLMADLAKIEREGESDCHLKVNCTHAG